MLPFKWTVSFTIIYIKVLRTTATTVLYIWYIMLCLNHQHCNLYMTFKKKEHYLVKWTKHYSCPDFWMSFTCTLYNINQPWPLSCILCPFLEAVRRNLASVRPTNNAIQSTLFYFSTILTNTWFPNIAYIPVRKVNTFYSQFTLVVNNLCFFFPLSGFRMCRSLLLK